MAIAFNGTVSIGSECVPIIVSQIKTLLDESDLIDTNWLTGIGSTRLALENLPNAKPLVGDIDLLCPLHRKNNDLKHCVSKLKTFLESNGYESKSFLGNIVSVKFPIPDTSDFVQVDLMLCEQNDHDITFKYLSQLRYYSNECAENELGTKGLHRTELIRFVSKIFGISFGSKGLLVYRWNSNLDSLQKIDEILANKLKRARSNKSRLEKIISLVEEYDTFEEFRNMLCHGTILLKNRYKIRNLYEKDLDLVAAIFFEKHIISDYVWDRYLWIRLGIYSVPPSQMSLMLDTFKSTVAFLKEMLDQKLISKTRLTYALRAYKKHLKSAGEWSVNISHYLENELGIRI